MSINIVLVQGNLGGEPRLSYTPDGRPVARFSVASHYVIPGIEGKDDRKVTDWHRVEVWGKQAEACAANLKKGSEVLVQGQNKRRTFKDREGITRLDAFIRASRVQFLRLTPNGNGKKAATAEAPAEMAAAADPFDGIPEPDPAPIDVATDEMEELAGQEA